MIFSGCLTGANYNMKADVLSKVVTQDPLTRQFIETWTKTAEISCYARSIQTDAVSDAASGKKYNADYEEYEFIKVNTMKHLGKRDRISNIRSADGEYLWIESELQGAPTVFQVQGVTSEFDPFGTLVQYEILAKRVEVQNVN